MQKHTRLLCVFNIITGANGTCTFVFFKKTHIHTCVCICMTNKKIQQINAAIKKAKEMFNTLSSSDKREICREGDATCSTLTDTPCPSLTTTEEELEKKIIYDNQVCKNYKIKDKDDNIIGYNFKDCEKINDIYVQPVPSSCGDTKCADGKTTPNSCVKLTLKVQSTNHIIDEYMLTKANCAGSR